jgi:PAS domain S-box-containing protein
MKVTSKKELSLSDAFELLPEAVVISASSGRIVDCNQTAIRQFGLKAKWELIGTSLFSWINEMERSRAIENDAIALEEYPKKNMEYSFIKADGSEYPAEMSTVVIETEKGKPELKISLIRDVSQRKMMEQELEEGRETIRVLLNAPQDTAYLIDKFGLVHASNETGARVLGKRSMGIVGLNLFRLLPPDIARTRREKVEEAVSKGIPIKFEDQLGRRFYENTVYPVYGKGRRVTRVALFAKDITERKEMEEELERYSKHLQELVEEKTKQLMNAERLAAIGETATMVGHDLRNPLQVIINTVFLARTELEEATGELKAKLEGMGFAKTFDIVDRQVDYMNKIVSDLQDFARDVKPRITKYSLAELLKESIPSSIPETIKITKDIQAECGYFDPYMMKRVFVNLTTNAIQAMPNGGELRLRTYNEGDKTVIEVSDNGVGIPEEFKPRLFKPLNTTKSIGTGMGLAVVKRLVTVHNGTIDVQSEVGKGTTFIIKLPIMPFSNAQPKS